MCIFSGSVASVGQTKIFVRGMGKYQYLVYSMVYSSLSEVAMVLPLPVPPNASEDAVEFINLEDYTHFFKDMEKGFTQSKTRTLDWDDVETLGEDDQPMLIVHNVGCYEASFVPTIKDFNRLDPRFRLSPEVWKQLPQYHDYGFAVFHLKEAKEQLNVHPMAFKFLRRHSDSLFYPTIHIHDQTVKPYVDFDHTLYCQADSWLLDDGWKVSATPASSFMKVNLSQAIIDPNSDCYKYNILNGRLRNQDAWLGKDFKFSSFGYWKS